MSCLHGWLHYPHELNADTAIITQPSTTPAVIPGTNVSLSVLAGGGGAISYAWRYSNGSRLAGNRFSGVTAPVLTIGPVLEADNGSSFSCVVTGGDSGIFISSQAAGLVLGKDRLTLSVLTCTHFHSHHSTLHHVTYQFDKHRWKQCHFCMHCCGSGDPLHNMEHDIIGSPPSTRGPVLPVHSPQHPVPWSSVYGPSWRVLVHCG